MCSKIKQVYIDDLKRYLDKYDLSDCQREDMIMVIANICDHFIDEAFSGTRAQKVREIDNKFKRNLPQTPERIRTKKRPQNQNDK